MFKPLCEAAGVKAVLLAAQCSQTLETIALLGNQAELCSSDSCPFPEGSASLSLDAWSRGTKDRLGGLEQQRHALSGIVIATPGRLVAHLQSTPGFSVLGLRFLVCLLGASRHSLCQRRLEAPRLWHAFGNLGKVGPILQGAKRATPVFQAGCGTGSQMFPFCSPGYDA